ncbi:RagB/SusD family nutrient uptake outer membrane protein [Mucilaginibacter limnophilus]|uniref:RagB/SusD family nutrient uptake outer membrane protein n=1 Tax=Mucilaginibacter limnophilus TaxID=1932778 RepID=A0A3S2V0U1_9SPHI|nr:RagB/SusD family nutrient uptake outer membrane protein [Mucilaginibacter limnophilus]RVU00140.1 RagB/SusD family nutrient uptake outer membrane protein [Mucilaginibacter limnophilus]
MKSIHKIIIAVAISIGASVTSCQRLDIPPTNIVGADVIFGSEAGVTSYVANLYRALPIEDFKYRPDGNGGDNNNPPGFKRGGNDWENFYNSASAIGEEVGPYGGFDIGGGFGYWPYNDIRAVNILIEELPKHVTELTQPRVDQLLAEGHFIRAYFYYGMAKRYGGVPIITVPQDPASPVSELQVHRNKEEEVWDFISSELDLAITGMSETSEKGRANKYVAAALKSRAMLFAACVAKYGSENFVEGPARSQGFVGIPAEKAQEYFQQAWDAAKLLEGKFDLYNANPDKEQNYVDLFLKYDGNPEVIFVKQYSVAIGTAHSWDATMSPRYFTANALSRSYPTLETVERWGALNVTNPDGTPKRYSTRAEVQAGLEPRLLASIYFPGDVLRGKEFDMQRGIYPSFSGTAANEVAKPANTRSYVLAGGTDVLYNGKQVIGFTGPFTGGDELTRTGFYVRKYVDYNKAQAAVDLNRSEQPWYDFRYGEILLNRAEAAIELGNTSDALECVNKIRSRAGASTLGSVDRDAVRLERTKELVFENQYYWDLKRWRTADVVLNNARFKGLMPYYVFNEDKFIFLKEPELFQRNYNFDKRFYYEPIPGGQLALNPNLYPNNPNY